MNLATLCNLLDSLTEEQRHLETTVRLTNDPSRQAGVEQRIRTIAAIVSDIRGEVLEREQSSARSTGTAQEFEAHLHRVLKAYGQTEPARVETVRHAARRALQ